MDIAKKLRRDADINDSFTLTGDDIEEAANVIESLRDKTTRITEVVTEYEAARREVRKADNESDELKMAVTVAAGWYNRLLEVCSPNVELRGGALLRRPA
ncbi:hypothetical protein [Thiobacillus sp.]